MKAVSQGFIDAWQAKNGKEGVLFIKYKRRFWNESAAAYQYEANWTQYTMRQFVEVGNITWKLDTPLLNTIKTSSVVLKFKNSDYQMLPTNSTTGLFKPDAASVAVQPVTQTRGYHPFLTQFQVLFGYVKADGTTETCTLFTGVAIDYLFKPKAGYCEVTVSGNEFLLQGIDAGNAAQTIAGGAVTAAGGNAFTTTLQSIGRITNVYDSGRSPTKMVQGTDYTISGLSTYAASATITLTQPAVGTITYDGLQWYTSKTIDSLVQLICIAAGVSSYNISAVTFPGVVGGKSVPIGQFSGSSFNTAWAYSIGTFNLNSSLGLAEVTPTVYGVGGTLHVDQIITGPDTNNSLHTQATTTSPYAAAVSTQARGVWSWIMSLYFANTVIGYGNGYSSWGPALGTRIYFMADRDSNLGGFPDANGYYLYFGDDLTCYLYRAVNGGTHWGGELDVQVASGGVPTGLPGGGFTGQHAWSVSRDNSGQIRVFCDSLLVLSHLDNTFSTSAYFLCSTFGRYGTAFGNPADAPNFDRSCSMYINSIVTGVVLTMANFSGMTCYDAVQKLAKLANYEWGFDSTGALFFRPKTPGAVVTQPNGNAIKIDQSDGISEITEFRPGYADVTNDVQVTYATYYSEYNSSNLPEAQPTSQQTFLTQLEQEDYTAFLLAYDPIIASGRAQALHDAQYQARRRLKIKSKIMPFLDLSDVIQPSFYNNPRMAGNVFGDPLELWGASAFSVPQNVLMRNMPGKVIGMILDPNNCTGEYEIQEVLS